MQADLLTLGGIAQGSYFDRIVTKGEVLDQKVSRCIGGCTDGRAGQDDGSIGDMILCATLHDMTKEVSIGRTVILCRNGRCYQ